VVYRDVRARESSFNALAASITTFVLWFIIYFVFRYPQAVLLGQTNRLNEAVSILKGLVLDDPNNKEHHKTLAGMYAQNGQFNDVGCCSF